MSSRPRPSSAALRPFVVAFALAAPMFVAVSTAHAHGEPHPEPTSNAETPAKNAELDHTPWTLPERPPRCTTQEADSGDVAHCLLTAYHDRSETGFGAPPAPGVGDGWDWGGYNYNGSPALDAWESKQIAANSEPIAGMGIGQLETHAIAQPLFEGFLREITANGYEVGWTIGYSFRCTSGNGGWNCPSGDPDDLSLHAWGLAIDMNAGANPIRTYISVDGVTACRTPMETDMPRWMIEAGEAWGLYWGGYGWTSGCENLDTERSSVFRDPPHFEFRGTAEQARAIAAFNEGRIPDQPKQPEPAPDHDPDATCFVIVDDGGDDVEACPDDGRPEAGWRLPIQTAAPEGTTAVMLNLTVTETAAPGFLTLEDCGSRSGNRETSALTYAANDTVAAMAVVPIDQSGRFCVYRSTAAHSIVDILGYIGDGHEAGEDNQPLWFEPSGPTRLTDTRTDGACAPFQECRTGPVPHGAIHTVPVDDDRPRIANIAVVDGSNPGYIQAGACDDIGQAALFSNLNFVDQSARSNLALVANGTSGSCIYAHAATHVVVDELGALDETTGYGWQLDQPRRVLDTRECEAAWCDARPGAGTVIELDVGTDAPGAAIAVTVTEPEAAGFVTVAPCSTFDGSDVTTSNVNYLAGSTVTNLALVDLDQGSTCLYTLSSAHIVVDVQAELTTEQTAGLAPTEPTRVHDSRA